MFKVKPAHTWSDNHEPSASSHAGVRWELPLPRRPGKPRPAAAPTAALRQTQAQIPRPQRLGCGVPVCEAALRSRGTKLPAGGCLQLRAVWALKFQPQIRIQHSCLNTYLRCSQRRQIQTKSLGVSRTIYLSKSGPPTAVVYTL